MSDDYVPALPWARHRGIVDDDLREGARLVERELRAAGADRAQEHPWGVLLRSPREPLAHFVNQAVVVSDHEPTEIVATLLAAAREDGLRHAQATSGAPRMVEPLAAALREATGREPGATEALLMVAADEPDRWAPLTGVRVVDVEDASDVRAAALREEPWSDEETIVQLLRVEARRATRTEVRTVLSPEGRHAMADVRLSGTWAQIETVHVLRPARGAGLGRRITTAGLELARHAGATNVLLVAAADDWPRRLYRRLGFVEALRRTTLRVSLTT